ncbi:MAG: hypothetical protein JO359_15230 [Candidatus Eremiobacteraeota bacterium]|nr:hypothetical protein [Candidatus Eremiobacteraeota bacterium]
MVVLSGRAASAEPTVVDASSQPIVLIQHSQPLTIGTWERPQIAVDTGTGDIPLVERRPIPRPAGFDGSYQVPVAAASVPGPDGQPVQLGAEEFPVQIPAGSRETIRIQVPAGTSSVMVPADTAVLSVNGAGATAITNYHGQLIAQQRGGPLYLRNVGGDAFVQNLRGQVFVVDSTFNRLRTRTALNNMVFQRCNAKQIEVSSVHGSILYNDGSFQPGLARFETVNGHVAIGVNGGANIAVKGQPGQVFQSFEHPAQFVDRNGEASASVGGGGPLVNVVTQQGRVYLYDGSLTGRRAQGLPAHWAPIRAPLQHLQGPQQQPPPQVPSFRTRR